MSLRSLLHRLPMIVVVLVITVACAHAQREKNIWYFSRGLGLDFNTATPTLLTGGMIMQIEGGAAIADRTTGQLLFYTDGITVWNRHHQPMAGGERLLGGSSATQSALIVPEPGSSSRYFIFAVADVDSATARLNRTIGVTWSTVDMTLDGGSGAVVRKNMPLDRPASEKITAVRHCNGRDYWIITRGWGNDIFHAFRLGSGGLDSVPVTSHGGHAPITDDGALGYMKASPNGRWLALATFREGAVELYPFDNVTGRVGAAIPLLRDSGAYGVSFSPDNSKLYIANLIVNTIDQYEITSGDSASILASRYRPNLDEKSGYTFGALQIAPDGKIYMGRQGKGEIGVINNPNASGVAMNFEPRGLSLQGERMGWGLPNMIDADANPILCFPPKGGFDYASVICRGACNSFIDTSTGDPIAWQWSFPGGTPSTSSERNPRQVCYQDPGLYPATLVVTNIFGSDTITHMVRVRGRQLELDSVSHPVTSRIELDSTLVGETRCDSIMLRNNGDTPLVLTAREAYLLSGADFTIEPGQYPLVIPPRERRGLRICYRPATTGSRHDGLVLLDSCVTIVAYIYSVGVENRPRGGFTTAVVEPCRGECRMFNDGSVWGTSWQWSFPGGTPDTSSSRSPGTVCYDEPGDHVVRLIVGNRFGADTVTMTVHVDGTPRPSIASSLDSGVMVMAPGEVGTQRWESVLIRAGNTPVVIGRARLTGNTNWSLPPAQFPLTIPAGQSREILLGVSPAEPGELRDTLVIDDPCAPLLLPLALHVDPPELAARICSTRLEFRGVPGGGLLRVELPYPNPARTRLRVPVEMTLPDGVEPEVRCTVHDLRGGEVGSAAYAGRIWRNGLGSIEEHGVFTLDVSGLAQGRYYLRLAVGENVTTIPVEVGR